MATIEQLEKQKQDLINSYTQILKDTTIPSSDKVQIIKDLSRAIANITDQINSLLPKPITTKPEEKEAARKEEIKQIKKEKKELQPKTIPVSAEQGEWNMKEIVRIVKIRFDDLPEDVIKELFDDNDNIQWDQFEKVMIPRIVDQIRERMVYHGASSQLLCRLL
jgi:hypothetical protein